MAARLFGQDGPISPLEIFEEIVDYMPNRTLARFRQSCRAIYEATHRQIEERQVMSREGPIFSEIPKTIAQFVEQYPKVHCHKDRIIWILPSGWYPCRVTEPKYIEWFIRETRHLPWVQDEQRQRWTELMQTGKSYHEDLAVAGFALLPGIESLTFDGGIDSLTNALKPVVETLRLPRVNIRGAFSQLRNLHVRCILTHPSANAYLDSLAILMSIPSLRQFTGYGLKLLLGKTTAADYDWPAEELHELFRHSAVEVIDFGPEYWRALVDGYDERVIGTVLAHLMSHMPKLQIVTFKIFEHRPTTDESTLEAIAGFIKSGLSHTSPDFIFDYPIIPLDEVSGISTDQTNVAFLRATRAGSDSAPRLRPQLRPRPRMPSDFPI